MKRDRSTAKVHLSFSACLFICHTAGNQGAARQLQPKSCCLTNYTFDPQLGTLESLIASGNLQLLQDLELQSVLTEWPAAMMNMLEWQQIERETTEQFVLPYTYDFVSYSDVLAALKPGDEKYGLGDFQPSPFNSDFRKLFASLRFEGMLNSRRVNLRELIEQARRLEENAAAILKRLPQQPM